MPPHHSGQKGDLGEAAHAAAVEAVEDALGDEKAFHGGTNIFEGHVLFHCFALSCAVLAFIAVAEDAGDNHGSEVGQLGADEATEAADSERPKEGRQE